VDAESGRGDTEVIVMRTSDEWRVLRQWRDALRRQVADHRRLQPSDPRTDREIIVALMALAVEAGLARKEGDRYKLRELA
jgi:hypothetical protein